MEEIKTKLEGLHTRLQQLKNFNDDSAFDLKIIFDEYTPIIKELNKANQSLYDGEMNAFGDMFSRSDSLISGKTKQTKKQTYIDIKRGLLADVSKLLESL